MLLCWITIHVLSSELEKRPEEVRITVFLNVFSFKKVNHTKKKKAKRANPGVLPVMLQ